MKTKNHKIIFLIVCIGIFGPICATGNYEIRRRNSDALIRIHFIK